MDITKRRPFQRARSPLKTKGVFKSGGGRKRKKRGFPFVIKI